MTIAPSEPTSTQDIYDETLTLGGSTLQAEVAASLAGGIESGIGGGYGRPQSQELAGGVGPAEGLFQFEPQTWTGGAGGGSNGLPATVDQASWEQQIQGFINDTGGPGGTDFGAWGPDLGAGYGYTGPPLAGSPVANAIAKSGAAWASGAGPGAESSSALGGSTAGATATTTALNANPFDLFGIPQSAASAVWSEVGPFLAKALLVSAGLGLVVVGLALAAKGDVGKVLPGGQDTPAGSAGAGALAAAAA